MALMLFAQHLIFGEQNPANPLADAVHINDASYSQQASGPDEDTSIESDAIVSEREGVEIVKKTNVAESIQRRPDLIFSNITIDGEKSNVSLSQLSASAVASLEVMKAVTPDLDADSRGGSLNLRSNPIFNLKEPSANAQVSSSYVEQTGIWKHYTSASYNRSFGWVGLSVGAYLHSNPNEQEKLQVNWRASDNPGLDPLVPDQFSKRFSRSNQDNIGFNASADFKLSDHLTLSFKGDHFESDQSQFEYATTHLYEDLSVHPSGWLTGSVPQSRAEKSSVAWDAFYDKSTMQASLFLNVGDHQYDLRVSADRSSYDEPQWIYMEFARSGFSEDYDFTNPRIPMTHQSVESAGQPGSYSYDEGSTGSWMETNKGSLLSFNARHDFELATLPIYVKYGAKARMRSREQSANVSVYPEATLDLTLADMPSAKPVGSTYDDAYSYSGFADTGAIRSVFNGSRESFRYDLRRSKEESDLPSNTIDEDVYSSYLLLNFTKGPVRTLMGLRMELTDLSYSAQEVNINTDGSYRDTVGIASGNNYTNWFPSFHIRWFATPSITLIGSWTSTIQRPWYGAVVPYRKINYDAREIEEGNPELNPTLYDNLDLSIDYRLSESSLLSLELFHKDVEDVVFWEKTLLTSGPFDGFQRSRNANGPEASESGLRFIFKQSLASLADWLEPVSVNLTATFQDTETEYPNRPGDKLPVPYRPEQQYALIVTYDTEATYAQIHTTYASGRLESVDDSAWADRYRKPQVWMNLSMDHRLTESWRVFLNIKNILEEDNHIHHTDDRRLSYYEFQARTYEIGLKWSI
ncbi:MAG: TonB-dependent receptor [Opitutales bacterium]|nr:TonB-dependent receptor [Opitutales bacterium]